MSGAVKDARRVFLKKGTCSQALCFLLDREFGHLKENEERAADPLAGGINRRGYQCGMLWGAAAAAGAQAFRQYDDRDRAVGMAMAATQRIVESFAKRAGSADCRQITGCSWMSPFGVAKYFLTARIFTCFNLMASWAPEAIAITREGLSGAGPGLPERPLSCAAEVAKKMGASDEEMVWVAGFAGGIGLSGNACGALGAALWMKTLAWCREHPGKTPPFFANQGVKNTLKAFDDAVGSAMLCHQVTGRRFNSVAEHTEFVQKGGCDRLIDLLARA
ncbi:MAG: C-GCAxxG-C-C family protein [Acidobacteria bacterium]|nr:C-GCAxxG-C-C family protein [Acidobacteriota bacterium]